MEVDEELRKAIFTMDYRIRVVNPLDALTIRIPAGEPADEEEESMLRGPDAGDVKKNPNAFSPAIKALILQGEEREARKANQRTRVRTSKKRRK